MMKIFIPFILILVIHQSAFSQQKDTVRVVTDTLPLMIDTVKYNDTVIKNTPLGKDTIVKKKMHSPKKATLYSTVLPGLGQIYNKKYWKVPIVYAAIGIPAYLFFDNRKWYNRTRYALAVVVNGTTTNDSLAKVYPQLKPLVDRKAEGALVSYRNQFRRDMDISILITLIMWGLNIVDATVDGHLKDFDVSEDVSLRIRPTVIQGTNSPGISFVFNLK